MEPVKHAPSGRRVAAPFLAVAAALCAMAPAAMATQINFYSSPDRPAFGSDLRGLGGDTSFELGVFADGFVPSSENTAQWAEHWVPAQRTKFSTTHNWFTSVFTVPDNTEPFTAGTPAYVWGFSGSESQGQWILFRSSKWVWPAADDTAPAPLFWSAKDADVVVVGALSPDGSGVSLRPSSVSASRPPDTSWHQWQQDELAGDLRSKPNDDADGDGVSNILEFIAGSSPVSAADRPADIATWTQKVDGNGKSYLEMRVSRRRDRLAKFATEVSSDLKTWTPGAGTNSVVSDTVDAITLRDTTPVGEGGSKRFMRVRVTPQ